MSLNFVKKKKIKQARGLVFWFLVSLTAVQKSNKQRNFFLGKEHHQIKNESTLPEVQNGKLLSLIADLLIKEKSRTFLTCDTDPLTQKII